MKIFELSDREVAEIKAWDKCKNKYHGAIGGHLTYSFIPTSVGTIVSVKCSNCLEEYVSYDQM